MESSTFGKIINIIPSAICFSLILSCCTGGSQASLEQQPSPTPTPGSGSKLISEIDGMVMVYVPGGTFDMGMNVDEALAECGEYEDGCQRDSFTNEEPVHAVTLNPYWIDSTEVTNAMYKKCVDAGYCDPPVDFGTYTRKIYYENSEYDEFPVVYVTWYNAQDYCHWAGKQLPTEAQWEFAARGEGGYIYPWGNDAPSCSLANYGGCTGDTTMAGSYESGKSPFGVYDMGGNVWEWVFDWYDDYPSGSLTDPTGPGTPQTDRVVRGGSLHDIEVNVRAPNRVGVNPAGSGYNLGFRCSISLP